MRNCELWRAAPTRSFPGFLFCFVLTRVGEGLGKKAVLNVLPLCGFELVTVSCVLVTHMVTERTRCKASASEFPTCEMFPHFLKAQSVFTVTSWRRIGLLRIDPQDWWEGRQV